MPDQVGHDVIAGLTGNLLLVKRSSNVKVHSAHSVGHISNGYRPCVSHWTSMPYEAILCRNPGRNLPES